MRGFTVIGARSLFTAMSIDGAYFMKACVQRIKRQNDDRT